MNRRWWCVLGFALALGMGAVPPCARAEGEEAVRAPVLGVMPGAGTPYGAMFPPGSVSDRIMFDAVNITTPYAAERLGALIQSLDAPVGGRPLGSPIYVVDLPKGRGSSVEASPRGAVLIYRNYLERLSGVTIDPAKPATVNAAVRAMLDNAQRARSLQSIIAHELGHLTQGHGRFEPGTEYARIAQQQADFIKRRMYGGFFTVRLEESMRAHQRELRNAGKPEDVSPSIGSHVDEYLADQHAVTSTYLKDGSLRNALDFWNRVSEGPGQGPGVMYSHPTRTARILNAVGFVEANPELFREGLAEPLSFRVARDLPPLTLSRSGDRIVVTGREAITSRLAAPERMVFERVQSARSAYYSKAGSPVKRLLYREEVRPRRLEPEVADAFAGRAPPASAAQRATASLHADVARGAIFVGPALAVVSGITSRMAAGDSIHDSVRDTARALDPLLLATDAGAGTLGAAAGALVPVSPALAGLRVVGGVLRATPALAGAMVAARLATEAVVLYRQNRLDLPTLVRSIDWPVMAAQIAGSAIGMNLAMAAISSGLLPALALGPVALVPLVAGIAGAVLAERLVAWWRSRSPAASSLAARAPASPDPASSTPVLSSSSSFTSPAPSSSSTAGSTRPLAPDTDPFADLRVAR